MSPNRLELHKVSLYRHQMPRREVVLVQKNKPQQLTAPYEPQHARSTAIVGAFFVNSEEWKVRFQRQTARVAPQERSQDDAHRSKDREYLVQRL